MIRSAFCGFLCACLVAGCGGDSGTIARGNALWADSSFSAALAEYRLAASQDEDDAEKAAFVAHAYAVSGQLDRARQAWAAVLRMAPSYEGQAVFDFLSLARRSLERGDPHGVARAVEAAVAVRPGAWPQDLAGPLARYYAESGDRERAVEFYELAMVRSEPDSTAGIMLELGRLREELNQCRDALPYFEGYARQGGRDDLVSEARWRRGNCSFQLATEAHEAGRLTAALELLDTVTELGVPESVQDQAWFLRAEIHFAMGDSDAALDAYRRVLELNPARTGQLVRRAQRRIDEIRFGEES
ncbi:MAG TPA: tetratricopeptide repeat protein [Longimicrobiales bacterium]|nr:tetratricopeptide repeat protein [Longimicrobiales bacterium]